MKLSNNFSLAEMIKSQTAIRRGIDNSPANDEHLDNLKFLAENVLQPVRDHFGPTVINSGYRSPDLNEAVGGSSSSQHCKGQAADIEVPGTPTSELAEWIESNLEFDQLILEGYTKGITNSGWVHVSVRSDGQNRKQTLTADFSTGKAVYSTGLNY